MSPGSRRLYFALACAVIGFFLGAALTPTGGARFTEKVWGGTLFGMGGLTLGAAGAGLGLAIGLFLAYRRGAGSGDRRPAAPPEAAGPSESRRRWLRRKRRRDAPKRFGKRGR